MNNPSPITVWHIGGEDVRLRIPLLLALRERGFSVGAVGSELGELFVKQDIPYFRYPLDRGINPWVDRQSRRQLAHLFHQHRPDVIHAFDTKPAIIAPIVAMKTGVPGRVRTITGMGYVFSSRSPLALALRPLYRYLQRRASAATNITIFQNSDDRAYFHQHRMVDPKRDALVLGSGIDLEGFLQKRPNAETLATTRRQLGLDGKLVITMIARLVVSKGVREYLQAAQIVCQARENVTFLLVGPLASEGNQAIPKQELENYAQVVQYLGPRNDVPTLLSLTDLFVLPSYYREGVPRVLLEAAAMALPLITTDMPGCKEVVKNGWNGLLVPPRDAQSLAEAILRLLQSKEERLVMGKHSRDHVQQDFSLTQVANTYADVYRRVLMPVNSLTSR